MGTIQNVAHSIISLTSKKEMLLSHLPGGNVTHSLKRGSFYGESKIIVQQSHEDQFYSKVAMYILLMLKEDDGYSH